MIAPSDSDSILEITSRMPRCHLTWSDANSIRGVVLPSRGIVWSVRATSNEAKVETVSSSSLVVAVSMSVAARGKKTSGQTRPAIRMVASRNAAVGAYVPKGYTFKDR